MPTSHENALQQRCQQIVTSPVLSPEQKRHCKKFRDVHFDPDAFATTDAFI